MDLPGVLQDYESGHLQDARRLDHRRAPLALRKLRSFFFVGVHAAKGLSVRVVHSYQIMMMAAAPVFSKFGFSVAHRLSRRFTR